MRPSAGRVFALGWFVVLVGAARAAEPDPGWEARARKALEDADRPALRALAAEYRKLPPEARRELPLRVREDAVEFAFRGEFRGEATPWEMLEYLVSGPGKDDETLLVADNTELRRVAALAGVFARRAGEGRRKWWSARLAWAEDGDPRSVELADVLAPLKPEERNRFLDELGVNTAGLGGCMNVAADPAPLPRKRVPARLYLTIRIAPEG
jgi:hypothetical protein